MYRPIRDYAIIGNLRSAALVSKNGSIDWLPAPFIDSPSVFGAILDEHKGGRWSIAPSEHYASSQRYLPNTNIVVTRFKSESSVMEIEDFIPIEHTHKTLPKEQTAQLELHRKITCKKGLCNISVSFAPRFDYARGSTRLYANKNGVTVKNTHHKGILLSQAQYTVKDGTAESLITLREGEERILTFRYNSLDLIPDIEDHYKKEKTRTQNFWINWTKTHKKLKYSVFEEWHGAVIRSALTLKILFFEPPGTIAAAATTSLPEEIGGVRNWDYRYNWIRDSAFVLQAFFRMGHLEEAEKYVSWLLGECYVSKKPENLQIMYSLRGEKNLDEEFLPHLEGYRGSKPVRIGNDAYKQNQWDIYGSILDTVWRLHVLEKDKTLSEETWESLRGIANYVVKIWKKPDEGLWEVRGGKQHFVYSKVMCWVALDRAIKLAKTYKVRGEVALWTKHKEAIFKEVMEKGWNEEKKSFVQSFGSDALDSSTLLLPTVGFIDGKDPKMLSTLKAIERELCVNDGLVMRYKSSDGLPGTEGAFLIASFWLIDALTLAGKRVRARNLLEKMRGLSNHVGLFSEEMNVTTKEFLGNFPQAYTHIGFINSAFNLSANKDYLKKNFMQ